MFQSRNEPDARLALYQSPLLETGTTGKRHNWSECTVQLNVIPKSELQYSLERDLFSSTQDLLPVFWVWEGQPPGQPTVWKCLRKRRRQERSKGRSDGQAGQPNPERRCSAGKWGTPDFGCGFYLVCSPPRLSSHTTFEHAVLYVNKGTGAFTLPTDCGLIRFLLLM